MESIQTKEASTALAALSKHKNRGNKPVNVAVQPVATVVDNRKLEAATSTYQAPVNPPATPEVKPEPQIDTRDYKEAWIQLKKHYDTTVPVMRQQLETKDRELAEAKTPKVALPKTREEIDAYRKQYPEAMDVFTTIALETASAESKKLREEIAEVNKFKAELKEKEAFKRLLEIHPDALEIRSSPKFKEWYDVQPAAVQNILANSTDLNAVSEMLDLYKFKALGLDPKKKKADEAQATVDASLGVDIKGKTEITSHKKIWTGTEINAICADYKTYLKYRVEIDDARREGRVDMSK